MEVPIVGCFAAYELTREFTDTGLVGSGWTAGSNLVFLITSQNS